MYFVCMCICAECMSVFLYVNLSMCCVNVVYWEYVCVYEDVCECSCVLCAVCISTIVLPMTKTVIKNTKPLTCDCF